MLKTSRCILAMTAMLLLLWTMAAHGQRATPRAPSPWSITVYGAWVTGRSLHKIYTAQVSLGHSSYTAITLNRRIMPLFRGFDFELEGEFIQHFDAQDHQELNIAAVGRLTALPWNRLLKTTIAIGGGLSYATQTPELERRHHFNTSQLLHNLNLELTFALPRARHWSLVARLHHRSGIAGIFNGVRGASNALGLGVKYQF